MCRDAGTGCRRHPFRQDGPRGGAVSLVAGADVRRWNRTRRAPARRARRRPSQMSSPAHPEPNSAVRSPLRVSDQARPSASPKTSAGTQPEAHPPHLAVDKAPTRSEVSASLPGLNDVNPTGHNAPSARCSRSASCPTYWWMGPAVKHHCERRRRQFVLDPRPVTSLILLPCFDQDYRRTTRLHPRLAGDPTPRTGSAETAFAYVGLLTAVRRSQENLLTQGARASDRLEQGASGLGRRALDFSVA